MILKRLLIITLCCAFASCSFSPWSSNNSEDQLKQEEQEANKAVEKAKAEAEAKKQAEQKAAEEAKAKAAADAQAKKLAEQKAAEEAKAKAAADAQAKKLAEQKAAEEAKAKAAADAQAKKQAEQKAAEEAKAKAAADAQAKKLEEQKAAEQAKAKAAADAQAKKLAEQKAAADAKAKAAADAQAKKLAEQKAAEEAKAKAAADAQAKKLAEQKAAEEAKAKAAAGAQAKTAPTKATATNSYAKAEQVSKSAAAGKLSSSQYTPLGANRKGNASKTIPEWTGKMQGLPTGLSYSKGQSLPDPYIGEKRLFTIHAGNYKKYASRLSDGQIALFKKYPETFFMHVYPSHRDGKPNQLMIDRTAWNASRTKITNGLDGLAQFTGGIPFPFPKSGAEVMWNARVVFPHSTLVGTLDDVAVYLNGNRQLRRSKYVSEFPYSSPNNKVGANEEAIGINAGLIHITTEEPKRQKGQMTVVHEGLDQVTNERKAWVYIPGARRVRRAPTVGFDTPDGPGGLMTVDDNYGFNGAMVRYKWKLLGKKEVYIPYHNYKFDSSKVNYKTLLSNGHTNPEYMRYELHRVWVVEATLKPSARHMYTKRRFYIDEDSWLFSLVDSYDGHGDLWRVGMINSLYDYNVKAYISRTQVIHDMQSGAYLAVRLINETGVPEYNAAPKGDQYYSPTNLRKMGR